MTNETTVEQQGIHEVLALAAATAQTLPPDVALLPPGYTLHDMEIVAPTRRNFRGKFATTTVDDFAAYFRNNIEPDAMSCARVYINRRQCYAHAVFDWQTIDGDPGHMAHRACLHLEPTPEWMAIENIVRVARVTQESMVDFLLDWADDIHATGDDGKLMTPQMLVKAFRDVTVASMSEHTHTFTDLSQERSALEKIEAKSKQGLPSLLTFHCRPYVGFDARPVQLRVIARPQDNKSVLFSLRLVRADQIGDDIAREFRDLILQALLSAFPEHAPAIFMGDWMDADNAAF